MPFTLFLLIAFSGWCVTPEPFYLPQTWVRSPQDFGILRTFACRNVPHSLAYLRICEQIDKDRVYFADPHHGLWCSLPHVRTHFDLKLNVWCQSCINEITVDMSVRSQNNSLKGLALHLFTTDSPPHPPQGPADSSYEFFQYSAQKDNMSMTRFIQEDKDGDRLFLKAQVAYGDVRDIVVSYGTQKATSFDDTSPLETSQSFTLAFSHICSETPTISIDEKEFTSKTSVNFDAPEQPAAQ